MKSLLLMRHAKSSWSDPDLADSMRPLNDRGRENAVMMATMLAEWDLIPDLVFSSHARRCQETWEKISAALDATKVPVFIEDNLYLSGPDTMLSVLRDAPEDAGTVLMIGHQPVMSSFARMLSNGSTSSACARAFKRFPTAAVAVFEPHADTWGDVGFGRNIFKRFACPKELVNA